MVALGHFATEAIEDSLLQSLDCLYGPAAVGEDVTHDIPVPGVDDGAQVGIAVTRPDIVKSASQ